ncbi:MAG TPA: aldose 1-epimerase family protein [Chloroflexota bacterium]|nr:aldose 1-epimerase family protein [Chloroflexota bacterium]
MPELFGRHFTRSELLERIGDVSQVGGARLVTLAEGPEAGVAVAEFRTGSGFAFAVLPGRGMDIGFAEYRGVPLCWRSSTGEIAAAFYEPAGEGWLRGFSGGLMATCGLTTAGWPSTDEGQALPLHGRASYLPARNIHVDGDWQGEDYLMWVQGRTRETVVFGENVRLTRRVWARLGESRLFIDDVVENLGHTPVPHMIAYHINVGFPVLDEGSELISTAREIQPLTEEFAPAMANAPVYGPPIADAQAAVLIHRPLADADGWAATALVNRRRALGLYVKQRPEQLPWLWQWKFPGQGTYVAGVEPANCFGRGRADDRARGTLQFLPPGGQQTYNLEIGVLDSAAAIADLETHAP